MENLHHEISGKRSIKSDFRNHLTSKKSEEWDVKHTTLDYQMNEGGEGGAFPFGPKFFEPPNLFGICQSKITE